MKTTREMAEELSGLTNVDEIERRLLLFLCDREEGYGVSYSDSGRGKARRDADHGGYFWLPCVLCGEWHGGQEKPNFSICLNPLFYKGVCPSCGPDAERVNATFPNGITGGVTSPGSPE